MLFSKSTGGFYSLEIHGVNIPTDAVEITDADHAALLSGQSQGKIIKADISGYPVLEDQPSPTLAAIKAAKNIEIERQRDAECTGDVTVMIGEISYQFQADLRSQSLVTGAVVGAVSGVSPPPEVWRSSDNINVTITVDDLKAIALAMIGQINDAYATSWGKKALVEAASTPEEVEAIVV